MLFLPVFLSFRNYTLFIAVNMFLFKSFPSSQSRNLEDKQKRGQQQGTRSPLTGWNWSSKWAGTGHRAFSLLEAFDSVEDIHNWRKLAALHYSLPLLSTLCQEWQRTVVPSPAHPWAGDGTTVIDLSCVLWKKWKAL